jgi:transcriptional regulator with XRE-family HTH domain
MPKPDAHPAVVLDLRKRLAEIAARKDMMRLANAAGISYHTIMKIHHGHTPNPTVDTFCRIEQAASTWTPEHGFDEPPKAREAQRPVSALVTTGA